MYLNQVYFGHGAFGVEAAARTFFGKSVGELDVREAALIGGLPRAPSSYSPFEHPEAAKLRRETVLRRMVEYGAVEEEEAKRLARSDLGLIPPERRRTTGQYFIDYVQQVLDARYGADMVFKGGLNVYTTLNPWMQLAAEEAVRNGLKALETRTSGGRSGEHPEGALITIEPQTGYVKAIVGGYDFFRSEFNRAVQARRQPGSAFKPFVYVAALEAGFTPASLIEDSPVTYPVGRNGAAWKPENYDRQFRGPTTLQEAVEDSINVVTIKLQEQLGVSRTIQVARRFGITSPLTTDLTLALGTSDLSLFELTSAYTAFANEGIWMPPTTVRYVTDAEGRLLEEHVPEGREAVSPEVAYIITHMLKGVVERGTGQGARVLNQPVAAKTGTTNDYSNAWFIGYTPQLATGVWVGYDRPRSLGRDETGSRVAVPIWTSYMQKVVGKSPKDDFPVPEDIAMAPVDLHPSNECVEVVTMAFIRGTEPDVPCGVRREMVLPETPAGVPPLVHEAAPVSPGVAPSSGLPPAASSAPVLPPPVPGAPATGFPGPPASRPTELPAPESKLPSAIDTPRELR
jgi:penicillin-binding protein 1A